METWFEAYFDQKIDIKGDMLDALERRYDWARFVFTLSQAKFFLTQWVPETLWHSRKQDEDQVRDHYDRGDDFYNAFCKFWIGYFSIYHVSLTPIHPCIPCLSPPPSCIFSLFSSGSHDDLHFWYHARHIVF